LNVVRYLFEDYALDTDRRELSRGGALVAIEPQVFDLLAYLVQHGDRVVTKDDLFTAVWNGRFVSESALTTRINAVRTALGDDGKAQRLIRTLRGRGTRFVGDVRVSRDAASSTTAEAPPTLAFPDRPSIAVLPFANLSGDPEQAYFADGTVDDIISALSRIRWLFVIARQSSFAYRGRAADIKTISRELGVRYVVEGSVRRSGNRVRITAQLIDAEIDAHIWADRYERDVSDIFALQDEITERIVTAVEPNVRAVEIKRALRKSTDSATAYDLYLRALHALHLQTEEGIKRAEALLCQAIELDPDYAEALGTLTDCITTRTMNGWHESVAGGAVEAAEFARRALAAGPDNSTCVASAAFVYATLVGRYDEGLELAERAIRLHPNSIFVRNRAGAVYSTNGKSDKAIAQFEAAQRMNPRDVRSSTFTFTGISGAHLFARRFDDAIYWGKRSLAVTPAANVARRQVAVALAHLGRLDEARAEIAELLKHQPNASLTRSRHSSFRHDWMHELYLEGLRKAGLREE
jgi:adenylate cyclase